MQQHLLAPAISVFNALLAKIESKEARIPVMGLGYVGLPLAVAFARAGFNTTGFDVDENKARVLNDRRSYVVDVSEADVREQVESGRFRAVSDPNLLAQCDCILVCVPTPLSRTNAPDLSFIQSATSAIRQNLQHGQLIVFESTTYPGCTDELVLPELRSSGFALDEDFLLAFSPERVDPGNATFHTQNIPRIVGGCSEDSRAAAAALYGQIVESVHCVSSARVAETAKLLENTFRAVNIGLVNELALMCAHMKIDVWEVIEAAKTKPYGFMPFYPGPGIGGHCIPLDPAYPSWRGRQFGFESRFINVAEQINASMPAHVVDLVMDALNDDGKALKNSRILILGVAYKKNVADVRESPALDIIQRLRAKKAHVKFHDPLIRAMEFASPHTRLRRETIYFGGERRRRIHLRNDERAGEGLRRLTDTLHGSPLTDEILRESDCVVIVTDHDAFDYARIVRHASLIVDTRNAIRADVVAGGRARVVKL